MFQKHVDEGIITSASLDICYYSLGCLMLGICITGDDHMPFVEVNITAGASKEQKAQLVEGVTELLVKVLDKNPASTQVVIKEFPAENWGISGRSVQQLRNEGKTSNISQK